MADVQDQAIPGPWEANCRDGTLKVRGPANAKQYKQREVCRVHGANRATVDLICAAPDLLAALKQILADWESVPEDMQVPDEINDNDHWDAVREAIALAEKQENDDVRLQED